MTDEFLAKAKNSFIYFLISKFMSLLQKLRSKSEEEKKAILVISTIVVMCFVGLLWYYLSNIMPVKYSAQKNQNNVSVIDLLGDFASDIQEDIKKGI